MTPQDFIAKISKSAQACEVTSKIPASFTIAQAALESGWGASVMGNNLFGIKADPSWRGPVVQVDTHEVIRGVRTATTAPFRAYPDWLSSINDHAKFLTDNPRYKSAFSCTNCDDFARAIQAAGYATDNSYSSIIISIIQTHNLERFDV